MKKISIGSVAWASCRPPQCGTGGLGAQMQPHDIPALIQSRRLQAAVQPSRMGTKYFGYG